MNPIITCEAITWAYLKEDAPQDPKDRDFSDLDVIFDSLDLTIKPGVTSLVGPNGIGKSTLLLLLGGRLAPLSGSVHILGKNSQAFAGQLQDPHKAEERNKLVSFVYQNMSLEFDENLNELFEDFKKNLDDKSRLELEPIIKTLALDDFMNQASKNLPFGAMQKAILAMALFYQSPVVIFDEPLFAVEPHEQNRIFAAIKTYCEQSGRSIIFAAHDLDFCKKFSHHSVLIYEKKKRKIALEGPSAEILTDENLELAYKVPMSTLYQRERLYRSMLTDKTPS